MQTDATRAEVGATVEKNLSEIAAERPGREPSTGEHPGTGFGAGPDQSGDFSLLLSLFSAQLSNYFATHKLTDTLAEK